MSGYESTKRFTQRLTQRLSNLVLVVDMDSRYRYLKRLSKPLCGGAILWPNSAVPACSHCTRLGMCSRDVFKMCWHEAMQYARQAARLKRWAKTGSNNLRSQPLIWSGCKLPSNSPCCGNTQEEAAHSSGAGADGGGCLVHPNVSDAVQTPYCSFLAFSTLVVAVQYFLKNNMFNL